MLFATIAFHAFFGVSMISGTTLLAPDFFTTINVSWIDDLLVDQRNGGAIAWAIGELPALVLALLVATQWFRADKREGRRRDRRADRDGDAELAAYNEQLARLAERDAGPALIGVCAPLHTRRRRKSRHRCARGRSSAAYGRVILCSTTTT